MAVIKKLKFKHIKGFAENRDAEDGCFEVIFGSKVTILIGANGSGKTAILDLLRYLAFGKLPEIQHLAQSKGLTCPYTSRTQLAIEVSDRQETATLEFSAAPVGVEYQLHLTRVTLNGAVVNLPANVNVADETSPHPYLGHLRDWIVDFARNSFDSYISPENLSDFRKDIRRDVLRVSGTSLTWGGEGGRPKDRATQMLKEVFALELQYDTLPHPQKGLPNRSVIANAANGLKLPIDQEASGYLWAYAVLLKVANRANSIVLIDEPEAYLHPRFQLRLLRALQAAPVQAIVATHSSVFIDASIRDAATEACFLNRKAIVRVDWRSTREVLEDLGIKASSLLQTNGVVWVEGLSDKIYIERWIELYCNEHALPKPIEGVHYSFLEYGGKCLAHLQFTHSSASDIVDADLQLLVKALSISRNHAVVMDSDKAASGDDINETKKRVAREAGIAWVTAGKEVENYLNASLLAPGMTQYVGIEKAFGTGRFNKVRFAQSVCGRITAANWKQLDLELRIAELVQAIADWNS
jgi:hypothetical protein